VPGTPEHQRRANAATRCPSRQIVPVAIAVRNEQLQHFDAGSERNRGKERLCRPGVPSKMEEYGETKKDAEMDDLVEMLRGF
jgi:hypothetical protein